MAHVIAVAGKGGVGKTTLCGMLIQYLCEQGKGPVLAVDADANSNLNEVLGVKVDTTLGDVREEIAQAEMAAKSPIPAGMSKADYAEVRFGTNGKTYPRSLRGPVYARLFKIDTIRRLTVLWHM